MVYISLYINIFTLASEYKKVTNLHIILAVSAFIGMALTLFCKFDYSLKVQYYLHCSGSLIFSACSGIAVFITYLFEFKRNIFNAVLTVLIAVILITDLILLLIFKQNALIEALPVIFALVIMPATLVYNKFRKVNKEFANASR